MLVVPSPSSFPPAASTRVRRSSGADAAYFLSTSIIGAPSHAAVEEAAIVIAIRRVAPAIMPDDDNDGRVDPGKACRLDSDDDATRNPTVEGSSINVDATTTPRSSIK